MHGKRILAAVPLALVLVAGCGSAGTSSTTSQPSQPTQQESTNAVGGVDPPEVALVVGRYSDCLASLHADLSTARSAGDLVAINVGSTILQFTVSKMKNKDGDPYTPAANMTTTDALTSVGC
jgi:hypothetical protein